MPNSEERDTQLCCPVCPRHRAVVDTLSKGQGSACPPCAPPTPAPLFGLRQTLIPFTNFIAFYCLQVHYSECHLFVSMLFAIVDDIYLFNLFIFGL